jgi:hypothetical protein
MSREEEAVTEPIRDTARLAEDLDRGLSLPAAWSRQVGAEDDARTSSVQRGLRTGIPVQGRFLSRTEPLVGHFQKLVLAALA